MCNILLIVLRINVMISHLNLSIGLPPKLNKSIVVRDHKSPDPALRFSHLCTKLLNQRVLSQKWAVLYLLHELADSPQSAAPVGDQTFVMAPSAGNAVFSEAFSYMGLHRLPGREKARGPGGGGLVGGDLGGQWGSLGTGADEGAMRTKAELLAERDDGIGKFLES
jgi:gamma-tubulin complex component 3